MELTFTNHAKEKILELSPDQSPTILLWYDTDECGCGVNGLPTFRLIDKEENSYKQVESDSFPVYIEHQQAVFFSNQMKLDFTRNSFRLVGNDSILNPFISQGEIVRHVK